MGYNIVVVGATGNVGREMLTILSERQFPVDEIAALASRRHWVQRSVLAIKQSLPRIWKHLISKAGILLSLP